MTSDNTPQENKPPMATDSPSEAKPPTQPDTSATTEGSGTGAHDLQPMPLDFVSPQFTLRAVLTGMLLAAILSSCNIYTGLKIGWGFNMSITAALVGYGFWMTMHGVFRVRKWELLENNINQTACSSGASVSSAGLVAPIPALAMITGQTIGWHYLALWVFSVCMVGITVAIALRRQMLLVDKLPFVSGVASAETLRELYAKGSEAMKRVAMLGSAAVIAAGTLLANNLAGLRGFAVPGSLSGFSLQSLTFKFDSTFMMYGVGGLVGIRACASMLIGAILAWGVLAPQLLQSRHLRLTTSAELLRLPSEVELPPEPEGYARYEPGKRQLTFKGEMSIEERDGLLAQSDDPFFAQAVRKLYYQSHFEKELRPTDVNARQTLRRLQTSTPLEQMPKAYTVKREWSGLIRYDKDRKALVVRGPMTEAMAADIRQHAEAYLEQRPNQSDAVQAFLAAVDTLRDRANQPYVPAGFQVPPSLAQKVDYNPATKTMILRGPLGEQKEALLAAVPEDSPAYADFRQTVERLEAGTQLTVASPNFKDLVTWLLWPGVTLMVVASLTSFAFSWRSILNAFTGGGKEDEGAAGPPRDTGEVTRNWFMLGIAVAFVLSVVLQISFFEILWWAAVAGVIFTFLLAVVAARVSGETNITPVGAMGKVTQLLFGVMVPGQPAANLMAANVTGGAASQCADLLHDMKCGYLIGASPRLQSLAQVFGAMAGALVGSAVYLVLIPNPSEQLITEEWAAPAVAAWKAVAELFMVGFEAIPSGTPLAMLIAGLAAIILAVIEKVVPKGVRPWMLSPASLGLAFVIQAHTSITMFIGALIAVILGYLFKDWTSRFLVAICAGIVAGESITGVGMSITKIIMGT